MSTHPADRIIEYAQAMTRHARQQATGAPAFASFHELVLAHGRIFQPAPLPDAVYPAAPGHAFQSATILSDTRALVYAEGLALLPDGRTVIEHAWCATFTGHAVDAGLGGASALAYLGIAFQIDYRRRAAARPGGRWAVITADPDGGTPNHHALTHGLPPDACVPIGTPHPGPPQLAPGAPAGPTTSRFADAGPQAAGFDRVPVR